MGANAMFKIAATLLGIFNVAVSMVWFFAPGYFFQVWGIEQASPESIIERRLGIMVLFAGVLMLAARNAGPSPARSAISYAVICACTALAATGVYDNWVGTMTIGALLGAGLNLAFAFWFAMIEWAAGRDRKQG
jgi:hypothetical protein